MKFLVLIPFLLLVTVSSVFSKSPAKKAIRKPNQVEVLPVRIYVNFGEKITLFVLSKTSAGGQIEYSTNAGGRSTKNISIEDYGFLLSKIDALPEPSNKLEHCTRSYVEISTGTREVIGCLSGRNKLANDIRELVNLISRLF